MTSQQTKAVNLSSVWVESFPFIVPIFKRTWWWLILSTGIEEAFTYWVGTLREKSEQLFISGAVFAVCLQFVLSALGIIIISQTIFNFRMQRTSSVFKDIEENFKYVLIESTRAILPVLLRGLLLILPGVIEAIRLYFVPFVAQFDSNYKQGKIDALERSRALCKGHISEVFSILVLTLVLSLVMRYFLESDVFSSPLIYIVVFLICCGVELYGDIVVFLTYVKLEESYGNPLPQS